MRNLVTVTSCTATVATAHIDFPSVFHYGNNTELFRVSKPLPRLHSQDTVRIFKTVLKYVSASRCASKQ